MWGYHLTEWKLLRWNCNRDSKTRCMHVHIYRLRVTLKTQSGPRNPNHQNFSYSLTWTASSLGKLLPNHTNVTLLHLDYLYVCPRNYMYKP